MPLVWLLTARQTDARLTHEISTALSRLSREGATLKPLPLEAADVAALAHETLGRALPDELIARVAKSTEGTPLFVEGTLRLLEARAGDDLRPFPVQHSAFDVLRDRLDGLPPGAR